MNTCNPLNTKHEAEAFLAPLERLPGLEVSARFELDEAAWYDAVVEVRSRIWRDRYAAETVLGVTTTLPAVRSRLERARAQSGMPPLLLTDYLTPAVAEGLLDQGIAFADAAGNVHLDGAAGYVLVLGRPRSRKAPTTGFTPLELELIFALLAEPTLLEAPLRLVSERTGISIGKISALLNELVEQAYLGQRMTVAGRRRLLVLQEPKRLLERWEFGYLEVLRPRLSPSTWRLPPNTALGHLAQNAEGFESTLIGGEHAADAITGFLKPATLTLHVPNGAQKRTAVRLRLVPSQETGDVVLLHRFQTSTDAQPAQETQTTERTRPYAHPILVRAELLASGSDRLREIADRMLDRILQALGSDAP